MYLPAGSTITLSENWNLWILKDIVAMGDSGDSNLVIHPHFTNLIFNEVWGFFNSYFLNVLR